MENALANLPKRQLAEQHAALVRELMLLWGVHHRMEDWIDPISAVKQMQQEARAKS